MTTESSYKPELVVQCPYDPIHDNIRPSRLDIHMQKCPSRFNEDIVTCEFNSAHRYAKALMPAHLAECPNADGKLDAFQKEKREWDALFEKKNKSYDDDLASQMGAAAISDPQPGPSRDLNHDCSWDTVGGSLYVQPGLEKDKKSNSHKIFAMNSTHVQMMTPAEKRKYAERTAMKSYAKKESNEAAERKLKMQEKRDREKKEEEEKLAAEKAERERIKNIAQAKKKAAKDKKKEKKRAAFLAQQEDQDGPEKAPEKKD